MYFCSARMNDGIRRFIIFMVVIIRYFRFLFYYFEFVEGDFVVRLVLLIRFMMNCGIGYCL